MSKINHHPDTATLIEFSAGVLPPAVAICVSAHLHYCEKCRSELIRLDQIASQLMSTSGCTEVSADLFPTMRASTKIQSSPLLGKIKVYCLNKEFKKMSLQS